MEQFVGKSIIFFLKQVSLPCDSLDWQRSAHRAYGCFAEYIEKLCPSGKAEEGQTGLSGVSKLALDVSE